jgi:hypothetical protein
MLSRKSFRRRPKLASLDEFEPGKNGVKCNVDFRRSGSAGPEPPRYGTAIKSARTIVGRIRLAFVGGEHDLGSAHDRTLALNSNLPTGWFADAWLKIWRGELGLRHFAHVKRLGPFEPIRARIKGSITFAHLMGYSRRRADP